MSADAALPLADARRSRRRLARLLADRRRGVVSVLAFVAAGTGATVAIPALIGVVVDAIAGSGSPGVVDRAAIAVAVLAVVGAVLQGLAEVRAARVGESALAELRTEVFDHAVALPVATVERAGTGEVVSRLTGDVEVLARAVRHTVPQIVLAGVELLLITVALVLVDWRLAAVAVLAGAPVATAGGWWYARHAPSRYRSERSRHGGLASGLLQGYDGRLTLADHRAGARYRRSMALIGRRVIDAELSTTSARNRLRPSINAALGLALVAVLVVGAALVARDATTVGAVSAAALYVVRLFDPVGLLLEEVDEVHQASAALARLVGLTDAPRRTRPAITVSTDSPTISMATGPATAPEGVSNARRGSTIEARCIRFGYVAGVPVIDGLDLIVEAGERVVVVGPSGAGKTTLAELVAGLQQPWDGEVLVGGRRIDDLDGPARSSLVLLVTQESHVFARTVADNIRMVRGDLPDDRLRDALAEVDALGWVERLPLGLDTIVGAGHHRLTPPQAQQLALARVVCADPSVVVLDEATADLDAASAARTERHLAAVLGGRTVLTVAHRLDAAARADRVVVMEGGAIVAMGPHGELVAAGGTYADLWAHWTHDRVRADGE